jgi:hypothetical protein
LKKSKCIWIATANNKNIFITIPGTGLLKPKYLIKMGRLFKPRINKLNPNLLKLKSRLKAPKRKMRVKNNDRRGIAAEEQE